MVQQFIKQEKSCKRDIFFKLWQQEKSYVNQLPTELADMVSKYIPNDSQLASVGIENTEAEKFLGDESNVKNKLGLVIIKDLVKILRNISEIELYTIIGSTSMELSLPHYKRIISDIMALNRTLVSEYNNEKEVSVPMRLYCVPSNGVFVHALTETELSVLRSGKSSLDYDYYPSIGYDIIVDCAYEIISLEHTCKNSLKSCAISKITVDRLKRLGITKILGDWIPRQLVDDRATNIKEAGSK